MFLLLIFASCLEPKRLRILKMNLPVHGLNVYDGFIQPINHRLTESTVIE